jgi:hypothetical protein
VSPIDRIAVEYARRGLDFAAQLERNYAQGFVFSTPDFFIMGRPHERGDAWLIEAFAGDHEKAWGILPYELPYIVFERFDNNPRFYPMETLRRMTLPEHETATLAATAPSA